MKDAKVIMANDWVHGVGAGQLRDAEGVAFGEGIAHSTAIPSLKIRSERDNTTHLIHEHHLEYLSLPYRLWCPNSRPSLRSQRIA